MLLIFIFYNFNSNLRSYMNSICGLRSRHLVPYTYRPH